MYITLSDQKRIQTIQEEFNNAFPFLRLEFFSKPHDPGCATAKKFLQHFNRTLGEYKRQSQSFIVIKPEMTVEDLEQGFQRIYGLNVDVFRKSGKVWLETTLTDTWTLEEQNRHGKALSTKIEKLNY